MVISFDISRLNQEQTNFIQAAVSTLLFEAGITHEGLKCSDGVCDIQNPSADVAISQEVLENKLAVQAEERERANLLDIGDEV